MVCVVMVVQVQTHIIFTRCTPTHTHTHTHSLTHSLSLTSDKALMIFQSSRAIPGGVIASL